MFKNSYHPKAFLIRIKNVKQGLATRTKIASALEGDQLAAKVISEKSKVRYSTVLHHLHLMEDESIVEKEGKRPYMWKLTGAGQKRLTDR
jgi:DNA-binding transcriptional ArsR family regulator